LFLFFNHYFLKKMCTLNSAFVILKLKRQLTMNSKLTIAAIALFAVTLGLGVLSPAMAAPNKVSVCHYEGEETDPLTGEVTDDFWTIISISSNGKAVDKHLANHANGTDTDGVIGLDYSEAECMALGLFIETVDED
jgi:hypothetical protein